jgi:hypothetical protein
MNRGRGIKVHAYSLQSESDGQTVYFYEDGAGTQLSEKWVLNSREGKAESGFDWPMFIFQVQNSNHDIGLNLANSTAVNFTIVFTNEDDPARPEDVL